jgi:hypothetical protein
MLKYYGYRNQFNFDIEQLRIDYEKKTFERGSFTHLSKGDYLSRKKYNEKIEELKLLGFKEIK